MKKLLLLSFISISFLSCKDQNTKSEKATEEAELQVQEKIAIANGIKQFDSISQIKFTFNVKVNDTLRTSRAWSWNTNNEKISLTEKDSTMTYTRTDSIAANKQLLDQKFINDSYWLLFPYQLKWSDANFSDEKTMKAPISGNEMKMITVSYPSQGGYTPGDSYDIYYNEDFMIQEWVYKAAGGNRQMATTWEDYEDFNGVKISKTHKSEDGSFELYFSDISVQK
ncbi:hypothetical protein [Christiangramia salexigens]|uniref:Selenophosphate synthetase n=1 Tax=Christiangramia salexigens TaxID=1913577 RepID=A0A1L3J7Z2_9FLAO|nr:hypothetical protein [Christiangramia salexigens]APG61262.1 hypothetical protein LPB144_12980 [Christiangramia salexigens]